jgi:hypothetical protein
VTGIDVAILLGAIASGMAIITTLVAWARWIRKRSIKSLETLVKQVAAQTQQLVPNGGSSVKDAVDAIRADVRSIAATVDGVQTTVKAVQTTVEAHGDAIHTLSGRVDDVANHLTASGGSPLQSLIHEGGQAHAAQAH